MNQAGHGIIPIIRRAELAHLVVNISRLVLFKVESQAQIHHGLSLQGQSELIADIETTSMEP